MEVHAHSYFLLQQLNVQREFGFLCDCTVAIGNVFFKAHRAVLAAFSNYFKMIFIHQSSECIKIQPSDIQPDVFSYLLHLMYTGTCPKQNVDQARLQDGIRFLHAHQLCPKPDQDPASTSTEEGLRASNLYGIQISSQLSNKVSASSAVSQGRSQSQEPRTGPLSLSAEEEPRAVCSVASGDELSARIKQERLDDEELDAGCLQEALRQSQALANQLAAELRRSREGETCCDRADPDQDRISPAPSMRKRKIACAVCSLRFSHKSQLQEHMYIHTGKPPRLHLRYRGPAHPDTGPTHDPIAAHAPCDSGGGASNGSSYSLDSEASQESALDGAV